MSKELLSDIVATPALQLALSATTAFYAANGVTGGWTDLQHITKLLGKYESCQVPVDTSQTSPSGGEAEGYRYLINGTGSGDFSTHDNEIAELLDGAWSFCTPEEGWIVYDQTADTFYKWSGAAWSGVEFLTLTDQTITGLKTFSTPIRLSTLGTGDNILTTDTDGDVQESGVRVESAPTGGSGFTIVEYPSDPTTPALGFVWFQSVDANTKKLVLSDGVDTYSVELTKD